MGARARRAGHLAGWPANQSGATPRHTRALEGSMASVQRGRTTIEDVAESHERPGRIRTRASQGPLGSGPSSSLARNATLGGPSLQETSFAARFTSTLPHLCLYGRAPCTLWAPFARAEVPGADKRTGTRAYSASGSSG